MLPSKFQGKSHQAVLWRSTTRSRIVSPKGSSAVLWLYSYRRFNHAFHLENLPLRDIKAGRTQFERFFNAWIYCMGLKFEGTITQYVCLL